MADGEMTDGDTHRLGYRHVDEDPNVEVLLATMTSTAELDAIRRLRTWERTNLELRDGQRLLDVGCGLGEAAIALGGDLGATGEVVGVDRSEAMVLAARKHARGATCPARFVVGDACRLDEPDACFDAVRSERTLQWLDDPSAAAAEMARVVRPDGRISLIDTDWSTLTIDVGDGGEIGTLVRNAMQTERRRPSNIGGRLDSLVRAVGFEPACVTDATQIWTSWDPDTSPAPAGCFSMRSLAEDLVGAGQLSAHESDQFVTTIHEAARADRFSMALTMYAVVAITRPQESKAR